MCGKVEIYDLLNLYSYSIDEWYDPVFEAVRVILLIES